MSGPEIFIGSSKFCVCIWPVIRAITGIMIIVFPFMLPRIILYFASLPPDAGISNEDLELLEATKKHGKGFKDLENYSAPSTQQQNSVLTLLSQTQNVEQTYFSGIITLQQRHDSTLCTMLPRQDISKGGVTPNSSNDAQLQAGSLKLM